MQDQIPIAIVDDHPMIIEGLKRVLRLASHIKVVAEGTTAEAACRIAKDDKPSVMLLDIGIPGNGITAAQTIASTTPDVKIIVLTGSDDEEQVAVALAAGVKGYLLKGSGSAEIIRAINAVHDGTPYVAPALASRLLVRKAKEKASAEEILQQRLSSRELEIFKCAAKGLSNKEIADKLGLQVRSVKNCMSRIFLKLGARSRVEAVMKFGGS